MAMQNDLINSLSRTIKPDESEVSVSIELSSRSFHNMFVQSFEGDYKKLRANVRNQVAKLEANTKKAGKRGPDVLKQVCQLSPL